LRGWTECNGKKECGHLVTLYRPLGLDEGKITEYVKWQTHQDSGQARLDL
jgi:hypothetical protein